MDLKNKTLNVHQVFEYLLINEEKFSKTQKSINCIERTLPCMCFMRDEDCLFIDIYEKLTEKYNHFLDEKYLENELNKYLNVRLLS